MQLMRRNNCRHLPVLHGRKVVGLISMRDLMNHELDEKARELCNARAGVERI